MTTIYGINNCDKVKKALAWLKEHHHSVSFYDFKKQPLTTALLTEFVSLSSWDALLNKRSTTYRNLPQDIKDNLTGDVAFKAVLAQPTLLKRPLLHHKGQLYLGFKEKDYQELFN